MSAIEWTDITLNPTTGCDRVSPGCDRCYALTMAKRLKGMGSAKYQRDGDPSTSGPGFGITEHPDTLTAPLRWRTPRKVFVNSMSDLFHDGVSDEFIGRLFAVMAATPQHTYQILTKRHGRMRSLLGKAWFRDVLIAREHSTRWPLPNVHLGVSVENQQWADIRIPALLGTPAAVRFLSCEPLLGPVDLFGAADEHGHRARPSYWLTGRPGPGPEEIHPNGTVTHGIEIGPRIDWVIAGGESGPGARPMHPDWARQLRDQCQAAGASFMFKQWGSWSPQQPQNWPVGDCWTNPDRHRYVLAGGGDRPHGEFTGLGDEQGAAFVYRVGKKAAGRELDGRTWDEYPADATGATS